MHNIHIMSGLPGSGKSTWVDQRVNPTNNSIVLRRDDCREALRKALGLAHGVDCPKALEYEQWKEYMLRCIDDAPEGCDIYIDQTTLTMGSLRKLLTAIAPVVSGQDNIIIECIHTNFNECLRRNAKRTGDARVPEKVMHSMAASIRRDPIDEKTIRQDYPWMYICINHDTTMEGI